jgi:hypothetical protein
MCQVHWRVVRLASDRFALQWWSEYQAWWFGVEGLFRTRSEALQALRFHSAWHPRGHFAIELHDTMRIAVFP